MPDTIAVVDATTVPPPPLEGAPPPPSEDSGAPPEPKLFDEAYVAKLRDEAAKHRREKKALADRLLDSTVLSVAYDLADPADLLVYVDRAELLDEDGLPDPERIEAVKNDLLEKRPYLRSRAPRGDIDQGGRGQEVETFSFNDWLRSAAR